MSNILLPIFAFESWIIAIKLFPIRLPLKVTTMLELAHIALAFVAALLWYRRAGGAWWRVPVAIIVAYLGIYLVGLVLYVLLLAGAMAVFGISQLFT